MDFLKAEIANKRKALSPPSQDVNGSSSSSSSSSPPPSKYMRRGEIERQKQLELERQREQELELKRKRKEEKEKERQQLRGLGKRSTSTGEAARSSEPSARNSPSLTNPPVAGDEQHGASATAKEGFNISNEEAVRRLRAKGQPIRLFAETDKERRLRLRALELIEEKGERMGQNDFMKAMQGAESGMALEMLERWHASDKGKSEREGMLGGGKSGEKNEDKDGGEKQGGTKGTGDGKEAKPKESKGKQGVGMDSLLDLELIKKDMARVYPIIYYTLKGLLQDWADSMAQRPDEVKQSTQGKLAAATQVQSAEYLKPLFKSLRQRSLAPDVLMRIAEIVHYMQKREYRHANDSYLQLSIGNAPWPIGVTMVGIHERSGREKIFSSNVAHVLNDEVSRKYIQSLKRLMTFAQTKYPPSDISMLMG
ncbi:Prp18-domain-containing protein [Violaceomyces palustris]|uniref:Prp18-domain-containing protein n=1 Tax=Violaceomyces palustris TaxID=1673888 RepID=A0ACD0NVR7_9BASI|nr:Prp18-domain-containing protein [Violaceomyces palustris]